MPQKRKKHRHHLAEAHLLGWRKAMVFPGRLVLGSAKPVPGPGKLVIEPGRLVVGTGKLVL